jgi:hypothetical protein
MAENRQIGKLRADLNDKPERLYPLYLWGVTAMVGARRPAAELTPHVGRGPRFHR